MAAVRHASRGARRDSPQRAFSRQLPLGVTVAPLLEEAAIRLCQEAAAARPNHDLTEIYRLVLHLLYERLAGEIAGPVARSTWSHPSGGHYAALRRDLAELTDRAARKIAAALERVPTPTARWEELAETYARLLDFQPWRAPGDGELRLGSAIGGERKQIGSYYTPAELVECLLDSALEPLLERAAADSDPKSAVLALRVCDPSCGSGQFLVGAARRMARFAPLPDVVARCLYGVDADPTAVEICRVALLLETGPGPRVQETLAALEAHVRHGNSLIGATREQVAAGIPDEAYEPLTGDDPAVCRALKRRNREQEAAPDLTADAWCAAFVWHKTPGGLPAPTSADPGRSPEARAEIARLAGEFGFFHWDLAFPEIHARGGFDVMLGNPPWERFKLQEKEWFALRAPEIAGARNAAHRQAGIAALAHSEPDLCAAFRAACRHAEAESHFLRHSGRFPLCGRGDVNAYTVFAETFRALLHPSGRAGFIVPAGIATDHTSRDFFRTLMDEGQLASLLVFENRRGLFPAVDSRVQFALVTLRGTAEPASRADFVFYAQRIEDLADRSRRIDLSAEDLALLNPNTRTCPVFRTRREAEIVRSIYHRVPVLIRERQGLPPENPWRVSFCRMFDMASDSGLFEIARPAGGRTPGPGLFSRADDPDGRGPRDESLPLYEAKLLHQFDHRWATFEGGALRPVRAAEKADPDYRIAPRYHVSRAAVVGRLGGEVGWLLAFRDIARATDERTAIATVLPLSAVSHHAPLLRTDLPAPLQACLLANFNSLVLDFVARTKVGGTHLTFFIVKQLPVLPPRAYSPVLVREIADRVAELVYTSPDLAPFARACGHDGPPYPWDDARRFQLRCELDALFFRLYGLSRDEVADVLDTFAVLRRKEMASFGEFRTRRAILEMLEQHG